MKTVVTAMLLLVTIVVTMIGCTNYETIKENVVVEVAENSNADILATVDKYNLSITPYVRDRLMESETNPHFAIDFEGTYVFSVEHGGRVNITSGDLNVNDNNITLIDCLNFTSGGLICSGS